MATGVSLTGCVDVIGGVPDDPFAFALSSGPMAMRGEVGGALVVVAGDGFGEGGCGVQVLW